ncbi:hypothetical protein BGZ63DRAFT_353876 [Mariannaea sp. PMI_226]|nr:hypothetical protein BGZ63DRAFT_353876 [Mariannaea sp. PMI_226]
MLFRAATTVAVLAVSVAAQTAQPYKLVTGPVLGISLARRDTYGYQPEQSVCGAGNTCAEACGAGFDTCASNDGNTHCYNPGIKQSCCSDGTGNSCDEGYYCTHDTKMNTWCCPNNLNLVECASKFKVDGELETDAPATTSAKPTTSTAAPSTSTSCTTSIKSTTSIYKDVKTTSSPAVKVTSTHIAQTTPKSDIVTTKDHTSTSCATPTASHSAPWVGNNGTVTTPTVPYGTPSASNPSNGGSATGVPPVPTGGASVSRVSAVLLAAAGLFALL